MTVSSAIFVNSDVGEGAGYDDQIIPLVQAANISCGAHAGNFQDRKQAIDLALKNGCCIGAHPGYPDRENFGRVEVPMTPVELESCLHAQLNALSAEVKSKGGVISYIKPHGALYNRIANDARFAEVAISIFQGWRPVPLMVLAGSAAVKVARRQGIEILEEGFLDRAYTEEGLLVPRGEKKAVISELDTFKVQALAMLKGERFCSITGKKISVDVDSVCVHGDTTNAVDMLKAVLDC